MTKLLVLLLLALLLTGCTPVEASCLNEDCSAPPNNGRDILDFGY